MSANPYENEPGYETAKKDEKNPAAYIAKIRHETLRISVIQRLEGLLQMQADQEPAHKRQKRQDKASATVAPPSPHSGSDDGVTTPATESSAYEYDAEATFNALDLQHWDPFADLMKRRFLWYYDAYIRSIDTFGNDQKDGLQFTRMEFEYPPNSMDGMFDYKGLRNRLEAVHNKLTEELQTWEKEGLQQVKEKTQLATQLAFQMKQLQFKWNESKYSGSRLEVRLEDEKNPFRWHLTMFGAPMTNLDGGIFNMNLHIPPNFPTTQPRVILQTPIYHHRVSSKGTLCYFPERSDEISSHLEAIVAALEDSETKFDPRAMVNPASFDLYWGGEDKRKQYNRKLRRSAQESSEFL